MRLSWWEKWEIALVVALVALGVVLFVFSLSGLMETEAAEPSYDYIKPLGEIPYVLGAGALLVLDQRTGKVWALILEEKGPHPSGLQSECIGHIDEFIHLK